MNPMTQAPFQLLLARPVVTPDGEDPRLVHLWWRADSLAGHAVQVYLDGTLVATCTDTAQREMWLTCDRSVPHRIELLALPLSNVEALHREHPRSLTTWNPTASTEITARVLRDESLPVDTRLTLSLNGSPIAEAAMWGAMDSRAGFGALFGEGSFGFDDATAPGLACGELGLAPLGFDGEPIGWRVERLPPGESVIELSATDGRGVPVALPVQHTVRCDPLPPPPREVEISPNFVLSWTE